MKARKKMPRTLFCCLFLTGMLPIFSGCGHKNVVKAPTQTGRQRLQVPFSAHFDPNDPIYLDAVKQFSGYTGSGKQPEWEAWDTLCSLQLAAPCNSSTPKKPATPDAKLSMNLQIPPQRAAPGSPQDVLKVFQSIYYNPAAAKWIKDNKLQADATLIDDLPATPSSGIRPAVPEPAAQSDVLVVVKTEWQMIQTMPDILPTTPHMRFSSTLTLQSLPLEQMPSGTLASSLMDSVVVNVADDKNCKKATIADADGKQHSVYNLACFFHRKITRKNSEDAGSLGTTLPGDVVQDMGSPDCSAEECYLILVGVHIISNETPTWIWKTHWWTSAKADLWQSDGVTAAHGKWGFFDTRATNTNSSAVANPYLEGSNKDGMSSNCMVCHTYAAYSKVKNPLEMVRCTKGGMPTLNTADVNRYFENSVQTHMLWTLALGKKDLAINAQSAPQMCQNP